MTNAEAPIKATERRCKWFACWGAALLVASCVSRHDRGFALYPALDPRPGPDRVARLSGYVQYVDGQDVSSYGSHFELMPGCHVVVTPRSWGRSEGTFGAIVVPTGHVTYTMDMRAGHDYLIDLRVTEHAGPHGSAEIVASERDPGSNGTANISPARTEADVETCLASSPAGIRLLEQPVSGAPVR